MIDSSERLRLAEAFLQEAVFQSRAKQAAGVSLHQGKLAAGSAGQPGAVGKGPTNCGLGKQAALELGLSERGAELFEQLWPGAGPGELERLRDPIAAWVARQDQLDRDRNHFMKAFRGQHGFDRAGYTPEQQAAWEAGLAEVNGRCNRERSEAAERLLA